MNRVLVFLCLMLLSACGGLELRIARAEPGRSMTLELSNGTASSIGYNLCFSSLERQEAAGWSRVDEGEDRICTAELRMLRPFSSVTAERALPPGAGAGTYRAVTTVEVGGEESKELTSEPFALR